MSESVSGIAAISPVSAASALEPALSPDLSAPSISDGNPFGRLFANGLDSLHQQLSTADAGMAELAAGGDVSLHDLMIKMEEARLSFQLAVQIRNRILDGYQEIMRMQL